MTTSAMAADFVSRAQNKRDSARRLTQRHVACIPDRAPDLQPFPVHGCHTAVCDIVVAVAIVVHPHEAEANEQKKCNRRPGKGMRQR